MTEENLPMLVDIGKNTFYKAFAPFNKEEDIRAYLNKHFSEKQIYKEWGNPYSQFFFAYQNEHLVGYLKINREKAQTEKIAGKSLEIERIYVIKEFQGQKIGEKLVRYTIAVAKRLELHFV